MSAADIITELRGFASDSVKRIFLKHGACEPILGVKFEYLKQLQKRIKKDHKLALELYDTGIGEAMYLAGLIADDEQMTKQDLQRWVKQAAWPMLNMYTVAWVAAGSKHGRALALKWIDSKQEHVAVSGWSTMSCLASVKDDAELDLPELKQLLGRVQKTLGQQPDRVRYAMNGFVIAVGSHVPALTDLALKTADKIGKVEVDMGDTSCKVPDARAYIEKVRQRGTIGKKRKTAKC